MEIEKKFLIKTMPGDLASYPSRELRQGYLCTDPTVRPRMEKDTVTGESECYLTYKGKGILAREEYNLPLTVNSFHTLFAKCDGIRLIKTRYRIPIPFPRFKDGYDPTADPEACSAGYTGSLTAELDVFHGVHEGLVFAEVEFVSEAMALAYLPEEWFGREVTGDGFYRNSTISGSDPEAVLKHHRELLASEN